MPLPLTVYFAAGHSGAWCIEEITAFTGESLPTAARLTVFEGADGRLPDKNDWILRGVTSNVRYSNRREVDALAPTTERLRRPQAMHAALISIRKTEAWWNLAQDERRAIFEERSKHIALGLRYSAGIARRLHHSRDLGEPFDFLTWFECSSARCPL
jgi:hypothetical protein